MSSILEIACCNLTSCINAQQGGADRIELFENIGEGGCTPSYGMIKTVKEMVALPVYVMIRPRGGNFCYNDAEMQIMLHDIEVCKQLNVEGIVFGVLNEQYEVDAEKCKQLLNAWGSSRATFHRAIDCTKDLHQSAETIADIGFERILTSGGAATAWEGRAVIKSLQEQLGTQLKIMAGAGVNEKNARALMDYCGIEEVHGTFKTISSEKAATSMQTCFTYSDLEQIIRIKGQLTDTRP